MLYYNHRESEYNSLTDRFFHNSPGIRIAGALLISWGIFLLKELAGMVRADRPRRFFSTPH